MSDKERIKLDLKYGVGRVEKTGLMETKNRAENRAGDMRLSNFNLSIYN